MAVAAALELHRRGLPVELDIVGPPALPDLPDFVRSHGFLLRGNPADARLLNELYAGADFFILPSRAECYGIVLCEAAAFGLPTVTANTGGIPEIIGRGDWGVALPRDASPTDYADWIAAAYADRSRYQSLSRAARRDYDDRLNWRAFCRQVTDLIGDLRHDPRATPRPRMTS
jgi:glycosyltransferase involved in cell wall biosynthesis